MIFYNRCCMHHYVTSTLHYHSYLRFPQILIDVVLNSNWSSVDMYYRIVIVRLQHEETVINCVGTVSTLLEHAITYQSNNNVIFITSITTPYYRHLHVLLQCVLSILSQHSMPICLPSNNHVDVNLNHDKLLTLQLILFSSMGVNWQHSHLGQAKTNLVE